MIAFVIEMRHIGCSQMRQITLTWRLDSDSNHQMFHLSTQCLYHMVVRPKAREERGRTQRAQCGTMYCLCPSLARWVTGLKQQWMSSPDKAHPTLICKPMAMGKWRRVQKFPVLPWQHSYSHVRAYVDNCACMCVCVCVCVWMCVCAHTRTCGHACYIKF